MKKYFVYIIKCENGSLYTGITPDLKRRFQEHREGRGGRHTRLSKVEKLLYYESYPNQKDALKREKQIKGWRKEKKENLIKYGNPKGPA